MKKLLLFGVLAFGLIAFGQDSSYVESDTLIDIDYSSVDTNKLGFTDKDCMELLYGTYSAETGDVYDSIIVININDNKWTEIRFNGATIFTAEITWLGSCELRIDWNEHRQKWFPGGLPVEYIEVDSVDEEIIRLKRTFIVLDYETKEIIKMFDSDFVDFKRIQ